MRDTYPLSSFFLALDSWEKHRVSYLSAIRKARTPEPSPESLLNYQRVWIEGYLESLADAQANEQGQ